MRSTRARNRLARLSLLAFVACGTARPPAPDAGPDGAQACPLALADEAPTPEPKIRTPRWAFEPWISKDISSTDDTYAFVDGFAQRGIPTGVVVLDSPWERNYNDYVPHPVRYHDFPKLVSDMHQRGVRVVLWTTQFMNTSSFDLEPGGDTYPINPLFEQGLECGLYVNAGKTDFWWKGTGGSIDFFNPRARAWLHRMLDPVLEMGVDGFKLDFGDSYIQTVPIETAAGPKSLQAYSEEYYADFYRYGRKKRGDEFTTMVRPWDESYQFPGRFFARKEHAPVGWVGDNRRDFVGLADALDHLFRSARAGYVVIGSDIGGYLDRDDKNLAIEIPYDHDAFARWVAMGAMTPFMELHGRANLAPWTVPVDPQGFVALYKYWATLHHELAGWLYDLAEDAYAGGPIPMDPQGGESEWPKDYRYVLGSTFLVAPILDATGKRDVKLPAGARWIDWFDEASPPRDGGTTAPYDATPLSKMPLFVREGSILTAEVESDLTGLGTTASKGALTVAIAPSASPTTRVHRDTDEMPTTIGAQGGTLTISRARRTTIFRVRAETPPLTVTENSTPLVKHADRPAFDAAPSGWLAEPQRRLVWIKIAQAPSARTILLTP